ncbi:tape measure protein [Latilactobacillus curvatus]|uniref:phage tail protein n=1 Tax=Latilactobacillus curvatus TaxID=28038 RepID=UPI001CBDDA0F|nr:tape measure protein [Latilactobacillus curvatus]MBZ1504055.1 tape measure protein [Latilactobacillus curvatus]
MADGTVKITIEADGNKAIKSAKELDNVFGQLGKGGKTNGLTSELDGVAKHSNTAKIGVMDLAKSIGLVKVASAAFGFVKSGLGEIVKGLNESSATWQTFEGNMKGFGKSSAEIAKVKKELQSYAQATIYSASDMASTYAQLAAVGTKNTTKLVKGFGGLAAAAEDPQQAMKSLSQQATQMAAKPKVAWEDFKIMLEQTPAGMAAVAKEMGMSLTDLVKKIQDGSVKTDDFFDAIAKAGTNDTFGKMATQYKTIGEAMDGLKETLTNKLQPAFDKVSKAAIGWVSSFTDSLDNIDLGGMINGVMSAFNGLSKKLFPIFGNLKTLFTEALSSINFSVVSKALQDGMKPITALFNGLLAIVNDVVVHILEIFRSMKPAFEQVFNSNAGATFGAAMSSAADMIKAAFTAVITVASNLTNIITSIDWVPVFTAAKGAIDLMYSAIKKTADLLKAAFKNDAFQALIVGITAGVAAFELIKGAVTAFQTAMIAFNAVMKIGTAVQTAFNAIMAINRFILIGVALAALVAGLVYFFTQTESGKEIWANFTAFLTQTWQATVAVAQTIWTALATFFSGLWEGIVTGATAIWNTIATFFSGLWNGIVAVATNVWSVFGSGLTAIWNGIVNIAKGVWEMLKVVVMAPILILIDMLTGNWNQLGSDLQMIWGKIKDVAGDIWNGLKQVVMGVVDVVISYVSAIWNSVVSVTSETFNAAKTAAVNAWNALKSGIINLANGLKDGAINAWNALKSGVINIANGIRQGAINAWDGMVSGVRGIISSVRSTFDSLRDINLFSIGMYIVQGLINGIGVMIGNVRNKISELASTVTSGIRNALKIHSPSRVMAELGMYTGMGFSNGIEGMIPTAEKMSKKLAEAVMIKKTFGVNSEFAGITAENATGIGRGVTPTNSVVNNYQSTTSQENVLKDRTADQRPTMVIQNLNWNNARDIRTTMQEMGWQTQINQRGRLDG